MTPNGDANHAKMFPHLWHHYMVLNTDLLLLEFAQHQSLSMKRSRNSCAEQSSVILHVATSKSEQAKCFPLSFIFPVVWFGQGYGFCLIQNALHTEGERAACFVSQAGMIGF